MSLFCCQKIIEAEARESGEVGRTFKRGRKVNGFAKPTGGLTVLKWDDLLFLLFPISAFRHEKSEKRLEMLEKYPRGRKKG